MVSRQRGRTEPLGHAESGRASRRGDTVYRTRTCMWDLGPRGVVSSFLGASGRTLYLNSVVRTLDQSQEGKAGDSFSPTPNDSGDFQSVMFRHSPRLKKPSRVRQEGAWFYETLQAAAAHFTFEGSAEQGMLPDQSCEATVLFLTHRTGAGQPAPCASLSAGPSPGTPAPRPPHVPTLTHMLTRL